MEKSPKHPVYFINKLFFIKTTENDDKKLFQTCCKCQMDLGATPSTLVIIVSAILSGKKLR